MTQGSEAFRKQYDGTADYDGDALSLLEVDGLRDGDDARSVLSATAAFGSALAGETSVTVALVLAKGCEDRYELAQTALSATGEIVRRPVGDAEVLLADVGAQVYTGAELRPEVDLSFRGAALARNRDYLLAYEGNVQAGTAKVRIEGRGNFAGTREAEFTVVPRDIGDDAMSLEPILAQAFAGGAVEPGVALSFGGVPLKEGEDYAVTYRDNDRAGTATAVVRGLGNFMGTREAAFEIVAAQTDIGEAALAPISKATFTGFALEPDVALSLDGEALVRDVDYRLSYSGNVQVGTAKVLIEGIGAFCGERTATFTIAAKKASTLKLTKSVKKSVKMGACYQLKLSKKVKSYKSSRKSVASVSSKGVVLAKAAGKAVITVTFTDKKTLKLTLTVVDPTMPTRLTLTPSAEASAGVVEGGALVLYSDAAGTARVAAAMAPTTAKSGVRWTLSDGELLRIVESDDGGCVLEANGVNGTATLTGTTERGGRAASVKVIVLDSGDARAVAIDQGASDKAYLGLDAPAFTAVVTAYDGSLSADVAWSSSAPSVAAIDAATGEVSLKKAGSATLTAKAPNGKSARLKLTVADPLLPTSVSIGGFKSSLKVKKTLKLTAKPKWVSVAPADKTWSVTWKSSDAKIAKVGKTTGKVTAVKAGKVKITATVTTLWNGRSVSKSVTKTITVTK